MTEQEEIRDGFAQQVCPKCGSCVITPFNTGTSTGAFECYNLACGWRGNNPGLVWISYSNRTSVEPLIKEEK